jgi:fructose-1,6-bisphosphatase I
MSIHEIHHIIDIIKKCCIEISDLIRTGDTESMGAELHQINKAGDEVKKLDLISNEILKDHLLDCKSIKLIGSEEEDTLVNTEYTNGKYMVCYDPLDGSSNIDVNITVGTIFAIYKLNESGIVSNGRNIVCAGYCLYGGSTQFIVADETHVKMYHLYNNDFVLLNHSIKIPEKGKIYSINESNKHKFIDHRYNKVIERFIEDKKTTRWVGSLVADAHRTLIKGGFFAYPGNCDYPNGKLRLLYEVYPFAYIFDKAGGSSSNGDICLLDINFPSENIHEKTPTILSSIHEIDIFNNLH